MTITKPASPIAAICALMAALALPQSALAQDDTDPIVFEELGIDPAKLEIATQIIDAGYPADSREALFFDTMDQMLVQMRAAIEPTLPSDDEGAIAILDEWIAEHVEDSKAVLRKHIPAIMQGIVEGYANIFTLEELTDILAFVQTPTGQRYFILSPKVLADDAFAQANQEYLQEVLSLSPPAKRRLEDRLLEYFEEAEARDQTPDT